MAINKLKRQMLRKYETLVRYIFATLKMTKSVMNLCNGVRLAESNKFSQTDGMAKLEVQIFTQNNSQGSSETILYMSSVTRMRIILNENWKTGKNILIGLPDECLAKYSRVDQFSLHIIIGFLFFRFTFGNEIHAR